MPNYVNVTIPMKSYVLSASAANHPGTIAGRNDSQMKLLNLLKDHPEYTIRDLVEAREYLAHPVLGNRLREAMSVLLTHRGRKSAYEIFFNIDTVKLRSCVTLFDIVSPGDVFADIIDAFYYGRPCARTLSILNSISEAEVNG